MSNHHEEKASCITFKAGKYYKMYTKKVGSLHATATCNFSIDFAFSTPRSSKQWGKLMKNAGSSFSASGSLENVLFGSATKCAGGNSSKIAHAR